MKKIAIMALLAFLWAQCPAQEQTKKLTKKEREELALQIIDERIEARIFAIDVERITSANQQFHGLEKGYGITVEEDIMTGHLPGSTGTNSGAYGSSSRLKFNAKIKTFDVTQNKKGTIKTIKIEAEDDTEKYRATITVFKTGRCDLSIKAQGQSTISFEGAMRL